MKCDLGRAAAPLVLVVLGLGLGLGRDASAIIMRHDVPEENYIVNDADYPATVDLFQPGDCSGTLIHASYLLTVAHCATDIRNDATMNVNGVEHDVAEVINHPEYNGWVNDISLVRFEVPVEGVTPIPLYRGTDELGQTITLVGRGLHATGLDGEQGASMDQKLRKATNVVSSTTEQWIEVYFEEPGEAGITDLEGVGAAGDSGGAALIETADGMAIAGLNSWGDATRGSNIGKYGSWDYQTRVSTHIQWIESVVGDLSGGDTGGGGGGDTGTDDPGGGTDTGGGDGGGDGGGGAGDTGGGGGDGGGDGGGPPGAEGSEEAGGCGCVSTPALGSVGGWAAGLAVLVGLRRRRQSLGL